MNNKMKLKITSIALVPIISLVNIISKRVPELVERYYSTGIDKPIRQVLSFITSIYPFSFAELLIPLLIAGLFVLVILLVIKLRKGGTLNRLVNIATYTSVLYLLFMIFWGFNYNRLSFDKIAGLEIEKSTKQELYALCEQLIQRANALRERVNENPQGVMVIPGGYESVFTRASKGYDKAAEIYPELDGGYGPPKKILLSRWMSYTGITGIYMPYTGEPNVNVNTTDLMLPNTAAHEMAHQRGFAREDEANYIAYVTCTMHPDMDFQYSGVMLGLVYSMNALASSDIEGYRSLRSKYSEGLKRDLKYERDFWAKYEGKVEKIANNVNNTYLKSNGQVDGVQSYGRMVDLLLAEYKNKKF
jgi:hypothetical protein